jgi:hypothetical protein
LEILGVKKPGAATTTVKLPLLPFGSGGVGLLALYHSWPEKHNASRWTTLLQTDDRSATLGGVSVFLILA